MLVKPVNNLSFGHHVNIDPKILKLATKEDLKIINTITRDIKTNRIDKNLTFDAIVDSSNNIVNVTHIEDGTSYEKLYSKNKSFNMKDFLIFLKRQQLWHEDQYYMERHLEEAFGK